MRNSMYITFVYCRTMGLGHYPVAFTPGHFPLEKNANNFVEIEAGMIKQYFFSRRWIDETIRC